MIAHDVRALLARWLLRPWIAASLAVAVGCALFGADSTSRPAVSCEALYLLATGYVAWCVPRFRYSAMFAGACAVAHVAATQLRAPFPEPKAVDLSLSVAAHVLLLVGTAAVVGRVRRDVTRLATLASTDDLTGTSSRRHFIALLATELAEAHRTGTPHGVAFVDLDRFHEVNNRFGHERGDDVLAHCARAMAATLGKAAVLGRLGGDEFAVLLREDDKSSIATANRLRHAVLDVARAEGLEGVLGVSIGVATCHLREGPSPQALLARADDLMYEAKMAGGSAVMFEAFDGSPRPRRRLSAAEPEDQLVDLGAARAREAALLPRDHEAAAGQHRH